MKKSISYIPSLIFHTQAKNIDRNRIRSSHQHHHHRMGVIENRMQQQNQILQKKMREMILIHDSLRIINLLHPLRNLLHQNEREPKEKEKRVSIAMNKVIPFFPLLYFQPNSVVFLKCIEFCRLKFPLLFRIQERI